MSELTTEQQRLLESNYRANVLMCASDFWWWRQYVKTRDEENKRIRTFPPKVWKGEFRTSTYLRDFYNEIDNHQLTVVLKPRRMLVTWLCLMRFMHKAQFAGMGLPGADEAFSAAVMSVDEDSAKYFLDKIYSVYDLMPDWLKELNPVVVRNALHCKFKHGGEIKGFSLKQSGALGYGFSEVLFDEAAFQMFARTTFEGTRPTIGSTGKMIVVSTPNGLRNWFAEVWKNRENQYAEFFRIELFYNQHPDRDKEWLAKIRASMSRQAFARQYLKSFSSAAGNPVFQNEYDETANESDNEKFLAYIPGKPVLIGWDLGYLSPAAVVGQMNHKDQFIGQHEFFGVEEDIHNFGVRLKEQLAAWYPPGTTYIHFIPHDARMSYKTQSKHGHRNDYQTLFATPSAKWQLPSDVVSEAGIYCGESAYNGKVAINDRLGAVRTMIRLRQDKRAGGVFSRKGCPELIQGFRAGYAYPEADKVHDPGRLEPDKGDYSHLHDALQMIATGYQVIRYMQKSKEKTTDRESMAKRSGYRIGT